MEDEDQAVVEATSVRATLAVLREVVPLLLALRARMKEAQNRDGSDGGRQNAG